MSGFIFAMLLVSFDIPVTVRVDDGPAPVETVKSEIPQTLNLPTPQVPKSEAKASTKTSKAKKKPKKK